jgi:uncharacterized protein (DUF1330 family)
MPAYVIAHYDQVDDPASLDRYRAIAAQSVAAFGGRYLVRGDATKIALEGDWAPRFLVVIAFPDLATAESWYRSEAYAAALALRQAVGPRVLTIVDGVAPEISAG